MFDLDLARRAVACRGWRWTDGALTVSGWRVCSIGANKAGAQVLNQADGEYWVTAQDELPDLTDPATRGCLLQLVREAWGKQVYAMPIYFAERITCWLAVVPDPATDEWDWTGFDGPDEVSALLAALEAAPGREL